MEPIRDFLDRVLARGPGPDETLKSVVRRFEREVILTVMREQRYHMVNTAKALGVSREGFVKMRHRHGLEIRKAPVPSRNAMEELLHEKRCPICNEPTTATEIIKYRSCFDCTDGRVDDGGN